MGGAAVSNMPLTIFRLLKAAAQLKSMLSASHQPPKPLQDLKAAPPATLAPPQYGAYFCSGSMLEPLKRYGITPKNPQPRWLRG